MGHVFAGREFSRALTERQASLRVSDREFARSYTEQQRALLYSGRQHSMAHTGVSSGDNLDNLDNLDLSPLATSHGVGLFAHYMPENAHIENGYASLLIDNSGQNNHATNSDSAIRAAYVDFAGPNSTDALLFSSPGGNSVYRKVSPAGIYIGAVVCAHIVMKINGSTTFNPYYAIPQGSSGPFNTITVTSTDIAGSLYGSPGGGNTITTAGLTAPDSSWHALSSFATLGGRGQLSVDGSVVEQSPIGTGALAISGSTAGSEFAIGRVNNNFYLADLIICDTETAPMYAARAAYYLDKFGLVI